MGKICMTCGQIIHKDSTECQYCNSTNISELNSTATLGDYFIICKVSEDPVFIKSMMELHDTDIIEYTTKMSQFKQQVSGSSNQRKCKYCGSTQFTPVRKKWSMLTGFMTNKTELICNNCGRKVQK